MVSLYKWRRSIGFHRFANIHLNIRKLRAFTHSRSILSSRLPSKASAETNAVCCPGWLFSIFLIRSNKRLWVLLGLYGIYWPIIPINNQKRLIYQVYLPSAMFVIVSWVSFLVKPEVVPGRLEQNKCIYSGYFYKLFFSGWRC